MDELRPYQAAAKQGILAALASGCRSVLAVSPTGSGKGTLIANIAAERARDRKRTLVLAHRAEIVRDIAARVRTGIARVGVLMPGETPDPGAFVQVASTQSMLVRDFPQTDLTLVDEAQHYPADAWRALIKTQSVGFTATPVRADGRALGDIFDRLLVVAKYTELLDGGYILPCDVLRPREYTGRDLAQDPVDAYLANALGTQAFLFAPSVTFAEGCVRRLQAAGVGAAAIHHKTPKEARCRHIQDLSSGRISVIANMDTMTEGVDVPAVGTVVLARNCRHWGQYIQMTGRALRPHHAKTSALLIDLHGVSHLHGAPTMERDYSLDGDGQGDCAGANKPDADADDDLLDTTVSGGRVVQLPTILGVELIRMRAQVQKSEDYPAPYSAPATNTVRQLRPSAYWAALKRDVQAGLMTDREARQALSVHKKSRR